MGDAGIQTLVGEYPNQITFVEDYVQVGFNGLTLTALTDPIVETSNQCWRFPEAGSRDALCSLIGQVVSQAEVIEGKFIRLRFDSGTVLILPLDDESREGPEAAHFISGTAFYVW